MGYGTGLGGYVGVADEGGTYGTETAPTHFYKIQSESLKRNRKVLDGVDIAAGQIYKQLARRVAITEDAAGDLKMLVTNKQFGLWIAHALGSSAVPVQNGTGASYTQTHTPGNTAGKSLTVQVARPNAAGTVIPFTHVGCKVTSLELSCDRTDYLNATPSLDAQRVELSDAAATPSYVDPMDVFHGGQMSVSIGTYGSEAVVSGVTSASVKVDYKLATDRWYAGSTTKSEPLIIDSPTFTGELDANIINKADFIDRYNTDGAFSLIVSWTGPVIDGTYHEQLTCAFPACKLTGDDPTLDNLDLVSGKFAWEAYADGTHPITTWTYTSTDTVL